MSSLPNNPIAAQTYVDEAIELELLLDELPKPQREAVRLCLRGCNVKRICSLLNLEERAAYRRLERGFAKLQQRISDLAERPRQ